MKKLIKKITDSLELNAKIKMSPLFIILSEISVVALVVSNIVATKSISIFDWEIDGFRLSLAASFVVFPFTYIILDIFSEVYGYAWSRKISWISFFANLFVTGILELVILLPGIDEEFSAEFADVLGSSAGVLFASLTAYMCGDLFNDIIFKKMKKSDGRFTNRKFALRSIISSLCGEIVDSMVFIPLLYFFIGGYGSIIQSFLQLIAIIVLQGVLKTGVEIILCPLSIFIVNRVKRYEEAFVK